MAQSLWRKRRKRICRRLQKSQKLQNLQKLQKPQKQGKFQKSNRPYPGNTDQISVSFLLGGRFPESAESYPRIPSRCCRSGTHLPVLLLHGRNPEGHDRSAVFSLRDPEGALARQRQPLTDVAQPHADIV